MLKSNQQFPFILMTQRWNDELIIYELKTNLNLYSHFKWETDCKMMSSSQICDFAVFSIYVAGRLHVIWLIFCQTIID